ncbi:AAA domain family protein [Acinetobacter sp. 8I-beige]|uniref:ATP-dependent DNA helicase n=1 Tax=Acinetobacter sp. 8I-beige TaxID=2653125 RepID=UPI0012F08D16|nr:ATP-dependent RecD-like DNA helicase [Acinetobacter sp. 8I-beige]VXA84852.1 AAA domain family protein [Acinetobacter sp. 8I-beige]
MSTALLQIQNSDTVICQNIEALNDQRKILSQNILSQLRNLIEGISVALKANSLYTEFSYPLIEPGLSFVRSQSKYKFLGKFHKLLQISASHYTLDGDSSERLMLKYYEYLYRIRILLNQKFNILILKNLDLFPIDLDPSLREYHEKISEKINSINQIQSKNHKIDKYYIHKTRPFYINNEIYYEVTFYRAFNKVNKYDRIIAFTNIDISKEYACNLTLQKDSIEVLGYNMPIIIIRNWEISIRKCEFNNYAKILGSRLQINTKSNEYKFLMAWLTERSGTLLDLIETNENTYHQIKLQATENNLNNIQIFKIIDRVRNFCTNKSSGYKTLRYLMLKMNNQIIKSQYDSRGCPLLSNLSLSYSCIPFEKMPFCTSLRGHNPKLIDLIESIDSRECKEEFLARHIKNNIEQKGILYTPLNEIQNFNPIEDLIKKYNNQLYYKHKENRKLVSDKGHIFINQYENDTSTIIKNLQGFSVEGIAGYTQAVDRWMNSSPVSIDDPVKVDALKHLFRNSKVAIIYGAAGTGKSTMVDHISHYFNDKKKLFLAHTNPAIDNLKRKISAQNSEFRTIKSHISKQNMSTEYDLLIIDECSTVSNTDILDVLNKTNFKLLILVGDVYQIESIQFGNWFSTIKSFIHKNSVFELTTPYRTSNPNLLTFWGKVRNIEDDISELMVRNQYTTILDNNLFENKFNDEIILCLNYDGLYGINNINRFLQCSNSGKSITWGVNTYRVGDPVLFSETERFRPVIYNNLKGKIIDISEIAGGIQFDIELGRPLTEFDVYGTDLEWIRDSIVRFSVYHSDNSDDDDDSLNAFVPFQVAYAVSIHKAQGLEYDSVKIVITDANEDEITHSIFYTAITRARENLKIFWTPETQQNVLKKLCRPNNAKDVHLLASRKNLATIN